MKIILSLIATLILTTNAYAYRISLGDVQGTKSGSSPVVLSDDFSSGLGDWTIEDGSWDTTGDILNKPFNFGTGLICHNTSLSSIDHYLSIQYTTIGSFSFGGPYLRYTGNTADYAYAIRWENSDGRFVIRECLAASCTTITGTEWTPTIELGVNDYVGVEVTGTGDNTEWQIWLFDNAPPERSLWTTGDANSARETHTWTQNPTNAADTGDQICMYEGSNAAVSFDNLEASSQ